MSNRQKYLICLLFSVFTIISLFSLMSQPTHLKAQGDPLPTATPLGTPPPMVVPTRMHTYQQPAGGTIILHVPNAVDDVWTVVQWQDANGGWHDVEGWRSQLTDGYVGWWVAPSDFATGPFRWLLYDSPTDETAVSSQSFFLPAFVDGVVLITIPQ